MTTVPLRAVAAVAETDGFDAVAVAAELSRRFAATAADFDRSGEAPLANLQALREAGLLRLTVPRENGGLGAGLQIAVEVLRLIGAGEPSTALILAMHLINHAVVLRNWPNAIAARLRWEAVHCLALVNALRVEPELGTPVRGGLPATVARRDGDTWRISGRKIYSTGITVLRWLMVWGRTDEAEPRTGIFLVPSGTPGITIVPTWNHLGMRATASHDVVLEDVVIPLDHAVDIRAPEEWRGPDAEQWAWSTLLVASLYDGVARSARDWLIGFLNERTPSNLGAPLATLPRVQEAAGEIEGLLLTNAHLLRAAARDTDEGRPPAIAESNLIKSTVTGNAIAAVEAAIKLAGNHALSRTNPLERHYRDVLCGRIHTPQDDMARLTAGKLALGLTV
jgi:alkylation response protein AidB-like acyl-CoA dehydrogenase